MRLARDWLLLVTAALAVGIAAWAYVQFWPDARYLWWSPAHDRNAHYWMAQCVGLDLRNGDVVHLARDIERMRVWGPLFPVVTGVVLAIGGPDYRLAVLTSLAAWVGAALFAFLAARRVAPVAGDLAGFVAAALVMASPAFQAFATDIMLEGPGACLSLAVVYAYLRARQEPSPASFRWFAPGDDRVVFPQVQLLAARAVRAGGHGAASLALAHRAARAIGGSARGAGMVHCPASPSANVSARRAACNARDISCARAIRDSARASRTAHRVGRHAGGHHILDRLRASCSPAGCAWAGRG